MACLTSKRLFESFSGFRRLWTPPLLLVLAIFAYPARGVSQAETKSETGSESTGKSATVFRFHMPTEPHTLDPSLVTSSDAAYLTHNLQRGLFSYSQKTGLKPEGARECRFETPVKLVCDLDTSVQWSDGSPVVAEDYVRAFRRLASPKAKNPGVDLLMSVKNAVAAHGGREPVEKIGVSAPSPSQLVIELDTADPEFLFKLSSSVLVPVKLPKGMTEFPKRQESHKLLFSGPYKLESWTPGKRARLAPNPLYKKGNPKRPPVEVIFVDDDQTALALYEQGELTFLRRLPTHLIAAYKQNPGFRQIPVARFDYVGFAGALRESRDLRAALALSADYRELKKLYDALGLPGCPGIPEDSLDRPRCHTFDLKKAREHLARVPESLRKKRLKLGFSKLGGDDVKKGMEWLQHQWKKNLGVRVDLEQMEQAVYIATLKREPPDVFRKGVGLDRPTCLAALETFAKGGSENFLKIDDARFEAHVKALREATAPDLNSRQAETAVSSAARKACGEGLQRLMDEFFLIPLGRIHFTLLARPDFSGWTLNEMNQLDLSDLTTKIR